MRVAYEAQQKAWNAGISAFARDTCMPILFIATLSVYWPLGLGLFVAYIGYKTLSQTAMQQIEEDNTPKLKIS